jgi:arylsulfatase A-like enzyme
MKGITSTSLKIAGISALLVQCSPGENAISDKPNIILCMADDQGWGDTGYNGHSVLKTPNLDNMSETGLRFDRFYAAAPVSSPTRGSVLTGRHPNRFGCFSWGFTLDPREITVAEALKTAGYTSGHFGKWHLGPVTKGSPINPGSSGFDEWLSSPNFYDNDPVLSREGTAVQTYGESSMVAVDAAIEFITKHSKKRNPFLAVVWFGSPHNPYAALEQDLEPYAAEEERIRHYYGEITGMDRAIGKLRQELKTLNIDKNTILWFCSDNGGLAGFSATGGRGAKSQIYEGGLRVPGIMEWPARIPENRITDFPAFTSDIYPTLLEIAGVTMENQAPADGVSLVEIIDNKTLKREKPMGFWQYPIKGKVVPSAKIMNELLRKQIEGAGNTDSSLYDLDSEDANVIYSEDQFPGHSAWLDWPYKLHRIESQDGEIRCELYNLEQDVMEQTDLSASDTAKVRAMHTEIEAWLKSVTSSLNGNDYK